MARKSESPKSSRKGGRSKSGKKIQKTITLNELKARMRDPETPIEKIRPYLKIDPQQSRAFAPAVSFDESVVDTEGLEGDLGVRFFNWASRRRRAARYRRRVEGGYAGVRIVSEGDSWFQYPFLLDDVIDHLSEPYAVFSLGGAGDLLADMVAEDELTGAIERERPDVFLISGGGNDLLGDGRLKTLLKPFRPGRAADKYPNDQFKSALETVEALYRGLFERLTRQFPGLRILCHGYDHAIPANGPWLGKPMNAIGIEDPDLQAAIVTVLIDRVNAMQERLAADFPGGVRHVDCRGLVGPKFWDDELHPTDAGFGTVAARFEAVIEDVTADAEALTVAEPLCPGADRMMENPKDLSDKAFRRIVARRARMVTGATAVSLDDNAERLSLEGEIRGHFEKIHMGADFLPASFLVEGAKRARAVCRIVGPGFVGSGFLIASRRFVMTNHHVLPDEETAGASVAEFGFEDGAETVRIPIDPAQFFVNDYELDFAIAACNAERLDDVIPIPLLRNPALVTRGDRVNIIQHPRGRTKEIAIHDNKVERLLERVVRYRTDTEPGSSGSPVFNNGWDLVALHHAGVVDGRTAMNEGIRMATIVAHLVGRSERESSEVAHGIRELLDLIPDSSPMLGFFDIAGVEPDDIREVEVPDFLGTSDFADLGFWNIEHFNARVSEQRLQRVADVLDRLNMDVMGLTEVHEDALDRLKVAMLAQGNSVDYVLEDTPGSQDLAVLYDTDTTTVTLDREITDRHATALGARTPAGRTAFPRNPLFARCKIADGNSRPVEFLMIVVHLKAFGDAQSRARRRLAAGILAEIIEDFRKNEELPVVLGGDFNEQLNNSVLSAVSDTPDLFALTADDAVTGAASYVGGTRRSLIDHIITSRDLRAGDISGDDAAIVRLDQSVRNFSDAVSDHVPVVMRLVLRDRSVDIGKTEAPGHSASIDVPEGARSLLVDFAV